MKKLGLIVLFFGSLCNAICITDDEFDTAIAKIRKKMDEKQQSVLDNMVSNKSMLDIKKQFEQFMNVNASSEGEKKEITDYQPFFIGDDDEISKSIMSYKLAIKKYAQLDKLIMVACKGNSDLAKIMVSRIIQEQIDKEDPLSRNRLITLVAFQIAKSRIKSRI